MVFILVLSFFYLFYSYPYISNSLIWRDIDIKELKFKADEPNYDIVDGVLYKGSTKRKLSFSFNPLKLVENNKVLRLALFYQVIKEDPLFLGPGLDKDSYEKSINTLEEVHKNLLNITGYNKDVIPVSFLKKTEDIMDAVENFVRDRNLGNAEILIKKYKETNDSYLNNVIDLKNKLEDIDFSGNTFIQSGAATSKDIILNDLNKIMNNHDFLAKEIKKREMCLKLSTYYCDRSLVKNWLEQSDNKQFAEDKENIKIFKDDELYYPKNKEEVILSGPYKIKSKCWKDTEKDGNENHYLYEIEDNIDGQKRLIPKIATTNYYVSTTKDNDLVINKQYRKHNLEWRSIFLTTSYACNDNSYKPKLATINAFYKKNKNSKILSEVKNISSYNQIPNNYKTIIEDGESIENIFFSEEFPSEDNLNLLSSNYAEIYSFIIKEQHEGNNKDWLNSLAGIKDELLERYLFIDRKFAELDGVINHYSFILNGYSHMYPLNKGDREAYVYYTKNIYPISYLGFSPSVWRNSKSLQFVDSEKSKIREDLKDYNEMVGEFGEETTKKITDVTREQIWYEILGYHIE